jgi:hypothetical protein
MAFKNELQKALTSSGDAAALNINDIDMVLHEELLRLQPLAQMLEVIKAEGLTHEYKIRTSHPMGWFEGETTGATNKNGVYDRKTVQLKIQRIWGSVPGFTQAVNERFINLLSEELSGSVQGMADLYEYGVLYGTANDIGFTGDAYQYSGLLPRIFSYAPGNVIDGAGAKITLDLLDQTLAKVNKFRQTRNTPKMWMMGLRMKQIVDGLQSKVQIPVTDAVLADGKIVMSAYAKNPIYETDYVVPEDSTTSPAATGTIAANGTLAAGDYVYQISSVTAFGEQVAGTASSAATSATTNHKANLTWTHDVNAKLYMIWQKKDTGAYKLLDIIPALTYDSAGLVNGYVEAYSDDGSKTPIAVKPLASGEQQVVIADINPTRGLAFVGLVDDMGRPVDNLLSFVELARTKDSYDYFLKSYSAARLVYPNMGAVLRHVKLS